MDKPALGGWSWDSFYSGCWFPAGIAATRSLPPSNTKVEALSIEVRVAYQQAIERIYWQHRLWSKENRKPKPALEAVP